MQLCSVKLSDASLLSDVRLRDQQLRLLLQLSVSPNVCQLHSTASNVFLPLHVFAKLILCSNHIHHAVPGTSFFLMQSPILCLIGPTFPRECSRRSSSHFQDVSSLRKRLPSPQSCRILSKTAFSSHII